MKTLHPPDYRQPDDPDYSNRRPRVGPLPTEGVYRVGGGKQQNADSQIGRVPQVPTACSYDVFGQDGYQAADDIWPPRQRPDQNPQALAGNVGAYKVGPLT